MAVNSAVWAWQYEVMVLTRKAKVKFCTAEKRHSIDPYGFGTERISNGQVA
jgi:hypothetical protein